ncbi:hypothetical protein HMPREF3228_00933 [Streptococcus mitis]|uniref:Uncharacterized protein n=1 Tax=Streptococcus mitis TaxID=28037 RepID=A0A133RZB1_STRMT|nr:hypothetical protein HMPREF3228_00933 [Streptococcus mitis]
MASFLVFSLIFIEYYLSQNQTLKVDNNLLRYFIDFQLKSY